MKTFSQIKIFVILLGEEEIDIRNELKVLQITYSQQNNMCFKLVQMFYHLISITNLETIFQNTCKVKV